MTLPTVTIDELSKGIQDYSSNKSINNVLEGILNDYMDLQYGKPTPYTTGKQVLPTGASIEDVKNGIDSGDLEKKYKDLFEKISEVHQSGDLTPRSVNDGSWDDKYKPVLVLVTPNK
ncbi:uncharacterized protein LOC123875674 [Maniola jurtina]|uniref:uncharacterized protein LOC123875674 n=1 Tax=Maniola jurtina TaxID=191418 RepID=UPI001E68C0F1|nr:uncharacterized protein LOC123875674 [Maniola jurtina]XP_045777599.1 uncharacterized protein LOC123875674 [Maniola jurtina]